MEIEASSLLGGLSTYSGWYIFASLLCWLGGVATHFIKKCWLEDIKFKDYWMLHVESSVISLVTGVLVYIFTLISNPEATLITFFTIGYILDSVINKPGVRNVKLN